MKQPISFYIMLLVAVFSFTQCGEHVTEMNTHFVGIWNGRSGNIAYSLSIDNGSNGYWHEDNNGVFSTAQGVARIKHDNLFIGIKSFHVDEYPTADSSGHYAMRLSGVLYKKQ